MAAISARSARLRQRAARLREKKQRESKSREVQRDKERLREKDFIAKTVIILFSWHNNIIMQSDYPKELSINLLFCC